MSISNLFAPNDYNLFCKSITPATGGGAPIFTNTIDTVNTGDILDIGPIKAGAIIIGHPTMVFQTDAATIDLTATTSASIDSAAPATGTLALGATNMSTVNVGNLNGQTMVRGANCQMRTLTGIITLDSIVPATGGLFLGAANMSNTHLGNLGGLTSIKGMGLDLLTNTQNITIDDTIVGASRILIGTAGSGTVELSRNGGAIVAHAPVTFPGFGTINNFEFMVPISATAVGCVAPTVNFILFEASKINNVATLRWRFTSPPVLSTALTTLAFIQLLPTDFQPLAQVTYPCSVIGRSLAPGAPGFTAGIFQIATNGAMLFSFQDASHPPAFISEWTPPEQCGVADGMCSYQTNV